MDKSTFRMILVISLLINILGVVSNCVQVVKSGHVANGIWAFVSLTCLVFSIHILVKNWNNPNLEE